MIRVATDEDFLAFYRQPVPDDIDDWLALLYEEHGRIIAIGGIRRNEHGAACGFVDRRGPISSFTLHRGAKRLLRALKQVGEPAVYALCDDSNTRAAAWLRRLGFKPVNDELWQVTL
jgi:RimJ/RimL family protein N-acetyltransferase